MEKQLGLFSKKKTSSKKAARKKWYIFVDGAARNNPGPAGAGIYIKFQNKVVCEEGYFLGKKTNNQAEYLALLLALFITDAKSPKNIHIVITSDSELLVKQMKGEYKVKNAELKKIKQIIDSLLENRSYEVKHVLREKNKIADELASKGIDTEKSPPKKFLSLLK